MRKQPLGGSRKPGSKKGPTKKSSTKSTKGVGGTKKATKGSRPTRATNKKSTKATRTKAAPKTASVGERKRPGGAMRRPPQQKNNTAMIVVVVIAGMVMLGAIIVIMLSEDPPTQTEYKDSYSAARADVEKMYKDLDVEYSRVIALPESSKMSMKKKCAEVLKVKRKYSKLKDRINEFANGSNVTPDQKADAEGWYREVSSKIRSMGSFLSKNS